jgi:hypothetical protein
LLLLIKLARAAAVSNRGQWFKAKSRGSGGIRGEGPACAKATAWQARDEGSAYAGGYGVTGKFSEAKIETKAIGTESVMI